jgi:hypothetical protein
MPAAARRLNYRPGSTHEHPGRRLGQLFFKKPLQLAIREGRKRTTIRRWPAARPGLRAGQRVFSPGLGWLSIESVEQVAHESLGDADARADGFDTAAALKKVLLSLYPLHADDGKDWFRVRFHIEQLRPAAGRDRSQPDPF